MTGLRDNLAKLASMRTELNAALAKAAGGGLDAATSGPAGSLQEITEFGSNPGDLRLFEHVPPGLPSGRPLVVCLHGCTQTAATYDAGSGWSVLAGRYGFVALFPQQQSRNNPNSCFSWFSGSDTARDSGEALSIRQMIDDAVIRHGIDRKRIFVTGLSAGGAMASSLLAAYPELFAAGAIEAGLPHGSAGNVSEALGAMARGRSRTAEQWGDLVRSASAHTGPWPRLAVWHGTGDSIVNPVNAEASILQALDLHGLRDAPDADNRVGKLRSRIWRNARKEAVVEAHTIEGMGHGVAVAPGGADGCGQAGAYAFDAGISSSRAILDFMGIGRQPWEASANAKVAARASARGEARGGECDGISVLAAKQKSREQSNAAGSVFDILREAGVLNSTATGRRRFPPLSREVHRVIDAALRAAGIGKK